MTNGQKTARMTVEINDRNLYRAIKLMAVEQDRTMKDIVAEALKAWLRKQEDLEDAAAIAEVENDERVPLDWSKYEAEMADSDEPEHGS